MPYEVANESFRTKAEITERCRAILGTTSPGQAVADDDVRFLVALFQHHDEWDQKSAGGVVTITTQRTPHGSPCFFLVKRGGDRIDIAFTHAVRLIPTARSSQLLPQALRDFRSAAREAIKAQIYAFRERVLQQGQICPVTGVILSRGNCAVDHTPPSTFDQLLFDFCRGRAVNPLAVAVGSEGGTIAVLEDMELLAAWCDYHQENARLRLLSRLGNLQLPKASVGWSDLWS